VKPGMGASGGWGAGLECLTTVGNQTFLSDVKRGWPRRRAGQPVQGEVAPPSAKGWDITRGDENPAGGNRARRLVNASIFNGFRRFF
jgi:hypothetical protein